MQTVEVAHDGFNGLVQNESVCIIDLDKG